MDEYHNSRASRVCWIPILQTLRYSLERMFPVLFIPPPNFFFIILLRRKLHTKEKSSFVPTPCSNLMSLVVNFSGCAAVAGRSTPRKQLLTLQSWPRPQLPAPFTKLMPVVQHPGLSLSRRKNVTRHQETSAKYVIPPPYLPIIFYSYGAWT